MIRGYTLRAAPRTTLRFPRGRARSRSTGNLWPGREMTRSTAGARARSSKVVPTSTWEVRVSGMPAPQASLMAQTAKMLFQSKAIKIPSSWDSALEDKFNQKLDQFKPSVPRPTNLFQSPSMSKIALDACNTVSEKFEKFIDDICKAICSAWSNWHSSTKFVGVVINAGVGILPPGGMIGGGQMAGPMILSNFPTDPANYLNYGKAIAMAIGQAWLAWEVGYTNPSIP